MKINDLGPRSRKVNIVFKVLDIGDVREVRSRRDGSEHTVCDIQVGDETGTVTLALWDEDISKVDEGSTYEITNGYTSLFRGNIHLNVGRYGELEESEQEITEVNEDNNVSEKRYPDQRRRSYGGSSWGGSGGSSSGRGGRY